MVKASVLEDIRQGKMFLLHDSSGREDEIDMVICATHATPKVIRSMRKDGGGLICLSLGQDIAQQLDLPFMTDVLKSYGGAMGQLVSERTAYGDRPAFSVSVNHIDTFTGITDADRSKTITRFLDMKDNADLVKNYYAPGHVHLLIASDIKKRRGHTELSIELAKMSGVPHAMVLCEMMTDDDNAMGIDQAREYAKSKDITLIDGGKI